jgi:catechol 2,3-dioxygenase-like lactoylglutathione lyase family enzyme
VRPSAAGRGVEPATRCATTIGRRRSCAGVPLHYVGLRVTRLRRSVNFYTRVLGLRETIRGDFRKYGRGIWVGLEDRRSHQRLELNWYPPGTPFAPRFRSGEALDHVGFLLGHVGRRTLEAEYERLLAAGARPTPMTPARTDGWMACVRDPDGNWIELFRWPTAAERRAERLRRRRSRRRRRT